MRTFDDTGKEFLGNYIGLEYAAVLPSLQPRHAVVFGKASSCENPVLVRLNDRDELRERFRAAKPPRMPQPVQPANNESGGEEGSAVEAGGGVAGPRGTEQ